MCRLISLDADMATGTADGGFNTLETASNIVDRGTLRACSHEIVLHDKRLLPAVASLSLVRRLRPLHVVVALGFLQLLMFQAYQR